MVVFIHCQPDTVLTDRSLISITDYIDVGNTELKVQRANAVWKNRMAYRAYFA